jgi:hypothetical protein
MIWILVPFVASLGLSFAMNSSQPLVLIHGLCMALPFVLLIHLVSGCPNSRAQLLRGLLIGATLSCLLFLAQLTFGAEQLDFRSNEAFSLPPHYRRGFALMPEVSTFAAHTIIVSAILICLALHPETSRRNRQLYWGLLGLCMLCLMLSRSTSFLIVAPLICCFAVVRARRVTLRSLVGLMLITVAMAGLLTFYFNAFYADRLENAAATRSIAMRLASVIAGLSPLFQGEVFGVGLGQNHEIERRAYDISHALGLSFGQLPKGVNSQIVARIFEEGWPAVIHFGFGFGLMVQAAQRKSVDPIVAALIVMCVGSFLTSLLITGYRGIYTSWIWLAIPAALINIPQQTARQRAGILFNNQSA